MHKSRCIQRLSPANAAVDLWSSGICQSLAARLSLFRFNMRSVIRARSQILSKKHAVSTRRTRIVYTRTATHRLLTEVKRWWVQADAILANLRFFLIIRIDRKHTCASFLVAGEKRPAFTLSLRFRQTFRDIIAYDQKSY